jgi:Carboxypeptidase regulatory-like domain/TonB-dependent Receptor Plug Domain
MKTRSTSILVVVWCLISCGAMWAQSPTTGEIAGQIVDPQGAAVANAAVKLTSPSGRVRETVSDASGRYRFPLLDPGSYSLSVQATGFAPATRNGAVVRITQTTAVEIQLTVAGTRESVSVVAEPIVVQDNNTEGRVIGDTQVNQLPLPTRNYTQLLALSPGAISSLPNNAELGRGDADINVNGQRSTSNNVIIDGTQVNSPGTNSTPSLTVPPPDAIDQFIVQTSMYDASQGRNSGGNVAVVTKSGTNRFHGNLFEYFRNDALNANDFFLNETGRPRPELKRNQFGFTLGGPIIHDRTFFFVAYQGTRERNGTSPTYSLGTTLMPQDLTNDRSTTTLTNTALNDYGVAINPVSLSLLQATLPNGQYAIPSAATPLPGSTAPSITPISGVSRFTEDYFNVNIDQQVSSKNKLSGKFLFSNDPQYQAIFGFLGANTLEVPGYGGSLSFHNRVLSLSDAHIFNPHLINEVRFGFSRIRGISTPQEPFTNAQFGITNPLAAQYPGMSTIAVDGAFTIGSSPLADEKSVTQTWQAQDTVSYTAGRHFLRVGGQFVRYDVDFYFHSFSRGEIIFNDFQDFLAGGSPTSFDVSLLGAGLPDRGFRASDGNAFVQDDIHLAHNFTLNAGLRLDHFGGWSEIRNRFSSFNAAAFAQNALPCTPLTPCTQGFTLGSSGQQVNPSKFDVSPRVGFAWSPRQQNDLSIRGGFGLYFDRFSSRFANLQVFNYPYDTIGTGLFSQGFFANPFPPLAGVSFPLPASAPSPITLPFDGIPIGYNPINGFFAAPNMKIPYTMSYNFDVQYSLARSWLLDVGYVGSRGNHLINLYNFNQGLLPATAPYTYATSPVGGFSDNKALFGFDQVQTEAESRYNALQTSLTKRFSHGLQFLASYTWSHSIDNNSGDNNPNAESEIEPLPGDQQNLATQFGSSDFDRKHRFVFSGVYDLPTFYKGDSGFAKAVANNWETNGLVVLQTGLPFTVVCQNDSDLNNRADIVPGISVVTSSGSTVSRLNNYFNTAAFSLCTDANNIAPFGTSPRNFLRGPGQKNIDFSIVKFFPVTEGSKIELRAEFFNIFNLVNFSQPNNNMLGALSPITGTLEAVADPGAITSTNAGPRIIQFALKYNF